MSSNEENKQRSYLSPHDRFVRGIMSIPKIAYDFFKNNLPLPIQSRVDLNTLDLQKDSFINDRLRLQVADLLYSVKTRGGSDCLYLLLGEC